MGPLSIPAVLQRRLPNPSGRGNVDACCITRDIASQPNLPYTHHHINTSNSGGTAYATTSPFLFLKLYHIRHCCNRNMCQNTTLPQHVSRYLSKDIRLNVLVAVRYWRRINLIRVQCWHKACSIPQSTYPHNIAEFHPNCGNACRTAMNMHDKYS